MWKPSWREWTLGCRYDTGSYALVLVCDSMPHSSSSLFCLSLLHLKNATPPLLSLDQSPLPISPFLNSCDAQNACAHLCVKEYSANFLHYWCRTIFASTTTNSLKPTKCTPGFWSQRKSFGARFATWASGTIGGATALPCSTGSGRSDNQKWYAWIEE